MFNSEMISLVGVAFWESIYMTIISSFFAYVIGFFFTFLFSNFFLDFSSACLWA